jgi:hypothetical protein
MSPTDVSVEVRKNKSDDEAKTEVTSTDQIDLAEYLSKIGDVISKVKDFSSNAKNMDYTVNSFNFSLEKMAEEYILTLNSKINIKPKAPAA